LQPVVKKELEMRSTFKILFYANKGKEKDGIVPIMGRITINGTQCHRNMQNHLFPFPHWVYSILTIPSMTLLRKNSEGECKRRKRSVVLNCKVSSEPFLLKSCSFF